MITKKIASERNEYLKVRVIDERYRFYLSSLQFLSLFDPVMWICVSSVKFG